jgi:two-component system, OmpR family, copper resistance phosphate regulon response regulator CusR
VLPVDMKILVIEDDVAIASLIRQGLSRAGYAVDLASDGASGLRSALSGVYHLLILDVMLPEVDGWGVCKSLRERQVLTPILMLTARDSVEDRVKGLVGGADDYLVKPFDFRELLARVQVLIRRSRLQSAPQMRVGDLEMDLAARVVRRAGRIVPLTRREFSLLEVLAFNEGRTLTLQSINEWLAPEERLMPPALQHELQSLRRKVDGPSDSPLIHAPGEGQYLLRLPDPLVSAGRVA